MGRREVLVQLDDELVEALDRVAKARGISRSEFLRRAAGAALVEEDLRQADHELQEAYRRIPQDEAWVEALTSLAAAALPEW